VGRVVGDPIGRVATPCRHLFHCTGCPFLAADTSSEDGFKTARIAKAIEGLVGVSTPDAIARPTEPYGYRHFAKQVVGRQGRSVFLGSYVAGTHHLTDNVGCPVLVPPLSNLLDAVATAATERGTWVHDPEAEVLGLRYVIARWGRVSGGALLVLVTSAADSDEITRMGKALFAERDDVASVWTMVNGSPGNALLSGEPVHVAGALTVEDALLGHRHRIGPQSFFQINPEAAEVMFGVVRDMAGSGGRVLEGYAGVGALTLPLTERFDQVVAIESHPEAHALLVAATEAKNVEAHHGDVATVLPELLAAGRFDAVVLDPPRRGLGETVVEALARGRPRRVVLLSCDPTTLGRDLPPLLAAGFVASRVAPIDQFPRTAHVETVTLLEPEGD